MGRSGQLNDSGFDYVLIVLKIRFGQTAVNTAFETVNINTKVCIHKWSPSPDNSTFLLAVAVVVCSAIS